MNCFLVGDRSEIGVGLAKLLKDDGWTIDGWNRHEETQKKKPWNLLLCAIGSVAPVGPWYKVSSTDWKQSVVSNCILPISLLRAHWGNRARDASVCFLAGANPNKAGANYSGYYTGKMALLKAVENIDAETPGVKFFALAPGVVFTKIHQPTYDSGIRNPGLEEKKKIGGVPIAKIYDCLKWCIAQPKGVVGGRNICVSDNYGAGLAHRLKSNPSMFKLRRIE